MKHLGTLGIGGDFHETFGSSSWQAKLQKISDEYNVVKASGNQQLLGAYNEIAKFEEEKTGGSGKGAWKIWRNFFGGLATKNDEK